MEGTWRALLVQGSAQIFSFYGLNQMIDLKQGSKFEFVLCLKVYIKN